MATFDPAYMGYGKVLALLEKYIDDIQIAIANEDLRHAESETDNVCAILANIKAKYAIK